MGLPASSGPTGTTGHGCWPPSIVNGTAMSVLINGMPAVKAGDAMIPHTCVNYPYPTHGSSLSKGSGTVKVEGADLGRIGDPVGCGGALAKGSPNVFAGG